MLKRLFQTAVIGKLELRNRIVMTAVHLGYADETGGVTDRLIDFYEERAKGGAGLIIVGLGYSEKMGHAWPNQLAVDRDETVAGLKPLASVIHRHGAKACFQIGHGGGHCHPDIIGAAPVAPSSIEYHGGFIPRELSIVEIERIIENFGESARRVKDAGFDAVEVAASGGILISQFLSPLTNKRNDRYGGELKNRLRFLIEIIESVRSKTGTDYPLLVRICGSDMMPGGHTLKEQLELAEEIEKAGSDCINVNVGWEESPYPMLQMSVPRGAFLFLAEKIKNVVKVPVIGGIGINDPFLAEKILGERKVDLVTMCRPLIADPELPKKAMEGRFGEIRMCVACNQRCMGNLAKRPPEPVACLVNVRAGRERQLAIQPATKQKKVMIVGGGPAGMEAARVAALRGHNVQLHERGTSLGGQLNVAVLPPGKSDLGLIARFYSHQLPKVGVKVRLRSNVSKEMVRTEKPDAVVIATGSRPSIPSVPGFGRANVVTAEEVLTEKMQTGVNVIIIGGGATGCETALFLAKQGASSPEAALFMATTGILPCKEALALTRGNKSVTLIEMLSRIAIGMTASMRFTLLQELRHYGVRMLTNAKAEEITAKGVVYSNGGTRQLLKADTVINALGYRSDRELFQNLEGELSEVYLIGDSKEPRSAAEALEEGFMAGLQL